MSLALCSKRFDATIRLAMTPACIAALCLGFLGCFAIYNATCHLSSASRFAGRQLVWLTVGGLALAAVSAQSAQGLRRATVPAAAVAYLALWLVLFYGVRVHGMRGWFAFNSVYVQPSELAKPVFVLLLAALLSRDGAVERLDWRRSYLPALLLCLLWILPIALQPDFGTVLVYVFTFAVLYWAMGGPLLHLLVSGLLAAPAAGLALATHPYLIDRLTAFLNPHAYANTAGWHLLQFRRALAAGGLTGQGWGHRQTQVHLPLGYSDSIFANTAEAIGFIGVLPLVLIVLAWVVYGVRRGAPCREPVVHSPEREPGTLPHHGHHAAPDQLWRQLAPGQPDGSGHRRSRWPVRHPTARAAGPLRNAPDECKLKR
jgi:cell division protein FtsW